MEGPEEPISITKREVTQECVLETKKDDTDVVNGCPNVGESSDDRSNSSYIPSTDSSTEELVGVFGRTSSLPDVSAEKIDTHPDSVSDTVDVSYSNNEVVSKRTKQQKNISEVVKNVHGLFSYVGGSIKSAYKPMEKNINNMVASAKNEYLKTDRNVNAAAADTINKYNTLQLNSDAFRKCDKFTPRTPNGPVEKSDADEFQSLIGSDQMKSLNSDIYSLIDESGAVEVSTESSEDKRDDSKAEDTVINYEQMAIQLKNEVDTLRTALIDKDAIKKNLESKIDLFTKRLETVTSERDAIVVKYAVSERNALEAIRRKEQAAAAEQTAKREVTMITQRLRTANAEKTRATGALDMKVAPVTSCHELSQSHREVSKLKEDLQSCDVKLKWAQSKLMSEMEAHKETSALVEKLTMQLKQIDVTGNAVPISNSQMTEMENQLREKEAAIILERHEKERLESKCKQLQTEVDQLKNSLNSATKEVKELRAQVESGAAEAAALRRTCSELREQGAKDCERLAVAQARAARCDTLATHLQQEQDKCAKLVQELEAMRVLREEALAEGELRMRREAELLRQAERLTAAGVKLQASCSEAEAKALALTVENASLRDAAIRSAAEAAEARADAVNEKEGRAADARALASRAAQHARGERQATQALEALRGEVRVLNTKHASAMKELKRELLQAKKRCDKYEIEGNHVLDKLSREKTGSTSSLSSYEGQTHSQQSEDVNAETQLPSQTPDNQQLVERIVSLQRMAAKRTEKLEFMEEHNRQLTQELQKKTKLLRSFMISTPSRGLSSPASDAAKAEIGRHGGVMSSVYGSHVTDETMTLELSLEINAKLQSLLEDTLLSNITLKENMDTLGDEITRLKESKLISKLKK